MNGSAQIAVGSVPDQSREVVAACAAVALGEHKDISLQPLAAERCADPRPAAQRGLEQRQERRLFVDTSRLLLWIAGGNSLVQHLRVNVPPVRQRTERAEESFVANVGSGFDRQGTHLILTEASRQDRQNPPISPPSQPEERRIAGIHVLIAQATDEGLPHLGSIDLGERPQTERRPVPHVLVRVLYQTDQRPSKKLRVAPLLTRRQSRRHPKAHTTVLMASKTGQRRQPSVVLGEPESIRHVPENVGIALGLRHPDHRRGDLRTPALLVRVAQGGKQVASHHPLHSVIRTEQDYRLVERRAPERPGLVEQPPRAVEVFPTGGRPVDLQGLLEKLTKGNRHISRHTPMIHTPPCRTARPRGPGIGRAVQHTMSVITASLHCAMRDPTHDWPALLNKPPRPTYASPLLRMVHYWNDLDQHACGLGGLVRRDNGGVRTDRLIRRLTMLAASLLVAGIGFAPPAHAAAPPDDGADVDGGLYEDPEHPIPPDTEDPDAVARQAAQGYRIFKGVKGAVGDGGTFRIKLVAGENVEALREEAKTAASRLRDITGLRIVVDAATTESTASQAGVIKLRVHGRHYGSATCGGTTSWAGCGGPTEFTEVDGRQGYVTGARVTIKPMALDYTDVQQLRLLEHELGHTLGLNHFNGQVDGDYQKMNGGPRVYTVAGYGVGDKRGLRKLAS